MDEPSTLQRQVSWRTEDLLRELPRDRHDAGSRGFAAMFDNEASETTSLFRNTGFINKQPHIRVRANVAEPKISDSQSVFLATLRGFPGGPLQGWQESSCGSYFPDLFFTNVKDVA